MRFFKIPKDGGSRSLRNFENICENMRQKTAMFILTAVITSEMSVCCILGAFAKLRKATVSFVMSVSVCPYVLPHGTSWFHWTDLHES